ncbi:sialate O-acetylesterase [Parabacteroides sp. PFB2-10]|uniref:sialate O-acetylesterase n=1 Tax=Parabacteroides sp. PFB2-10 TaxID=1742405 RepID=UPI002474ADD3|nr:sialate O-acetylesterase [Parabacteroides sp. PFB2-10]MDH6312045.1 sialate O-acetylesterase [Parabacteroides sp. PFB2-10]MDL2244086.1 sialate O-acetylesterase [Parabacteroides sp. OttesenSCG-928-J18]
MRNHVRKPLMNYFALALFFFIAICASQTLSAAVRLPKLISDRMVLQRDTELTIWGWANPGEKVTVRFRGNYYDAVTDSQGNWSLVLPPQKAGGPFILEVNEIIIRDVLVGDVWLCSGQSNQETPVARLVEKYPEINVSNNHMIRHYKVPTQNTIEDLKEDIPDGAKWYSATASDVMNWSALAYFYAQEAYAKYQIPIGMLNSSVGGTPIEGWISQEHLKEFPQYLFDKTAADNARKARMDKGAGKWQAEDLDDSDWATMTMPGFWRNKGLNARGVVWFRKDIEVPASMDGKHAKLYMGTLVNADSTFVNGHFVGNVTYQYPPRKYDIPAGVLHQGTNTVVVKLTDDSGGGGFVEDKIYKIVGDDVEIDLTGDWKYKVGVDLSGASQPGGGMGGRPGTGSAPNMRNAGSGYYNGMIYPIRHYQVKGAIWYQGESNAGRSKEYVGQLKALINNWRELWQMPQMPFLLVQLPNFQPKQAEPSESGWAGIREAQFKTALQVPYTAMAVTYDVGEWNDIHPLNKKDVAHRLFLGARKLVYGEKLVASGPMYKEMKIEGDKIIITFTETGSGLASNGSLKHFAIAGEDRKFVWADAMIRGNKVIVSHKEIKNPVAVRYAWSDNPEEANLKNKEGLLASPFRTDDW